ncbi:ABC transporter permease [Microbacterium sp. 18062]|uniref:ABC transporter permease n=1 Tax=Microbacterium sp. 18062 TaxID=2681410 RepID=UPI00135B6374|nr:ABC transporter permease [Microbacterium sp. 18062]
MTAPVSLGPPRAPSGSADRTAGGALSRLRHRIGSLGGALVIVLSLELVTRLEILPSRYLPPPSVVVAALAELLTEAIAWQAIGLTLLAWSLGLGIAALVAVPLGMLLGTSELAYRATRPIVEFLRPVPSVALIPVVFLIFRPGSLEGTVFLAAFAATWPLLVQVIYGVRSINPIQMATARSFQIGRVRTFLRVVLPGATPYLVTGLRISSSVALILVVTGQIIMGAPGIGLQINRAREGADVPLMYAYVIIAGVLGLLLNMLFAALERRALHWHASQRAGAR